MKIGIISLGLIGGSILKALAGKGLEITAISSNNDTINKAKSLANNVSSNIEDVSDCDVIFVCAPISKTTEMLDKLEKIIKPNCIVTDVASVKEFITEKKRPYVFIGSHPMAGTEFNGFDASFKELFEGAKWVLTPNDETKNEYLKTLQEIISLTGAETITTTAKEHDVAVAMISHMPMLVSQALYKAAEGNELALRLASSGFRDMTRLALSNTTMAADMINFNKKNIDATLKMLCGSLSELDSKNYKEMISKIKSSREKMYSKEGKNVI